MAMLNNQVVDEISKFLFTLKDVTYTSIQSEHTQTIRLAYIMLTFSGFWISNLKAKYFLGAPHASRFQESWISFISIARIQWSLLCHAFLRVANEPFIETLIIPVLE